MAACRPRSSSIIGASFEGRPLRLVFPGSSRNVHGRVLIISGQHGDEPLAMDAVERLAANGGWGRRMPGLEIAMVPCLNPDGRIRGTRENAQGIDLNRDHQLLKSPEVRALHELCRGFRPDLVIDVHTYPPRRRVLVERGLELGEEIMLETNNHPASLPTYRFRWSRLVAPVLDGLAADGIRASRYLLLRPSGRIRSSSADVVDARNGLSALFGATTVLIEGREPTRRFGSRERTRTSLERAILGVLSQWYEAFALPRSPSRAGADPCADLCMRAGIGGPHDEGVGGLERGGIGGFEALFGPGRDAIPLDARRLRARRPAELHTLGPRDRVPRRRALPGRPQPELEPRAETVVPVAYAVPNDRGALLALLERHGFDGSAGIEARRRIRALAQAYVLEGRPSSRPGRATRALRLSWTLSEPEPNGHLYFFTDAPRGAALSTLLEPESRFGLHRHAELGISVLPGRTYPVARVLSD